MDGRLWNLQYDIAGGALIRNPARFLLSSVVIIGAYATHRAKRARSRALTPMHCIEYGIHADVITVERNASNLSTVVPADHR
eukprot:1685610-Pyramimonas_sp.AAC.1